jgi:hypothetical protein
MPESPVGPTLELGYAPPPRSGGRWVIALLAGAVTTALALGLAWGIDWVGKGDFTIIGLYAGGIFPVGALLLGMVAAVGYWAGARYTGTRITWQFVVGIGLIAILAHFAMHYVEYKLQGPLVHRSTNTPVGFIEYHDLTTRAMRFKSTTHKYSATGGGSSDDDAALGTLGYGVRALEIAGFAGGAMLVPLLLKRLKYCDLCQRYQRRTLIGKVPGSDDRWVRGMAEAAKAGQAGQIKQFVGQSRVARNVYPRFILFVSQCTQCRQGVFHIDHEVRKGRSMRRKEVVSVPVDASFVAVLNS